MQQDVDTVTSYEYMYSRARLGSKYPYRSPYPLIPLKPKVHAGALGFQGLVANPTSPNLEPANLKTLLRLFS